MKRISSTARQADSCAVKLRNLDMLRALLALMVLMGHARMLLWMPWQQWHLLPHATWETVLAVGFSSFRYGHEAVMVFFSLSGFFIHLRAVQDESTGFAAAPYLRRRARRILPPYYAALLFTFVMDCPGHHWFPRLYDGQTGSAMLDSNFRDAGYRLASVLPALLAQPTLLGTRFGSNGPLWSIGYEVFFYLLYPLFMLLWRRSRWLPYAMGLSIAIASWFHPVAGWWTGRIGAYPVWLAGALVAELWGSESWKKAGSANPLLCWLLSCGAALSGVVGLHFVTEASLFSLPLNMIIGASVICVFLHLPCKMVETGPGRLLEWLGVRTYSLYIMHFPVLVIISAWCFQTYGERPAHGWLAAGGVLAGLVAGLLGFQCVERHFLVARQVLLIRQ